MTDTTTAPRPVAFTPGPDDMLGAYLGVHGTTIGEDGAWLLLGHVEPRKAVVVIRKIGHSDVLGLGDEDLFGWSNPLEPLTARVEHRMGLFERHPNGCQCQDGDEPGDPGWCLVHMEVGEDPDYWWCDYSDSAQDNPAAVPVTVWTAV